MIHCEIVEILAIIYINLNFILLTFFGIYEGFPKIIHVDVKLIHSTSYITLTAQTNELISNANFIAQTK